MRFTLALVLYRLLFLLLTPLLLVVLLLRSTNHPAYRKRLLERLGILEKNLEPNGIVVHAASVGEIIALKPFISQLLIYNPEMPVTVTTFTPTGSAQVKKLFADKVQHCYLPLDNIISTTMFLKRLKPKAMVFMETELWPNLISQCKSNQIKLLLVNGRLSDKSMRSYQKLAWLITPAIQSFDRILTQSQVNQENYIAMGATPEMCKLSGNLKFDVSLNNDVVTKQRELNSLMTEKRKIWLIASSHPGDEALVLKAFEHVKQQDSKALLIIVPRHPERFEQVAKLAQDAGNHVLKRSQNQLVSLNTQVWIIDTLGELLAACSLADVVTMGGSFSDIGGHNPLEPALFQKPVIVGPNMSNFKEILVQLMSAQGIVQLVENEDMPKALANEVLRLFTDETSAQILGSNSYKVVQANQGATTQSLTALQNLLKSPY
ncbi:lipid IV(A) 3-deoxy-D-manno-octulosonic acid transferase [Cognaticolwellia beringensis]|uniref:3-deoxy-D-manno-octulosonic acid transferase n=1 Tax=Cognaticolwellia beringensis TaxID=1967665 RepID=A0A222G6T9_9GAMM|nr:lipid IV(A) 3-deoxy-D-manno-octulosonic acid transferase [Cognaticolwellia beringensis]ASP47579.1 3-deoxy-D-manno-octulosonic acid transferase [Cognaticolwellia beringensis]